MQNYKLTHVSFISRLSLGFLFIYHGLVPKILWLSSIEIHLASLSGLNISANIISPIVGIGEMILGCSILFFKKSIIPVYIAVIVLLLLLLFVSLVSPKYLIDAFNPVTTNVLGLGFCYLIWFTHDNQKI
ncbi:MULTISPECIES: DoxX-like family protein [Psychrobacter]|uniref:DoxX-like family protein n=1 Tax=Psychrobacter TaxID=497 RepID=UPI000B362011|nr:MULTISPECIES: DoxX-like family protein [Psychrobacter]